MRRPKGHLRPRRAKAVSVPQRIQQSLRCAVHGGAVERNVENVQSVKGVAQMARTLRLLLEHGDETTSVVAEERAGHYFLSKWLLRP